MHLLKKNYNNNLDVFVLIRSPSRNWRYNFFTWRLSLTLWRISGSYLESVCLCEELVGGYLEYLWLCEDLVGGYLGFLCPCEELSGDYSQEMNGVGFLEVILCSRLLWVGLMYPKSLKSKWFHLLKSKLIQRNLLPQKYCFHSRNLWNQLLFQMFLKSM